MRPPDSAPPSRDHPLSAQPDRVRNSEVGTPVIDGSVHVSRLTEEDVYAVFDRGMDKLEATGALPLAHHPDLPDVLKRHGIQLVQ